MTESGTPLGSHVDVTRLPAGGVTIDIDPDESTRRRLAEMDDEEESID